MSAEASALLQSRSDELRAQGAAVVGEGCIMIAAAGARYGQRYASVGYAVDTVDALADYLTARNIAVHSRVVPFFCGSMNITGNQMVAARDEESAPAVVTLPAVVPKRMRQDRKLIDAYSRLIQSTVPLQPTNPFLDPPTALPRIDLSADDIGVLRQDLKARLVLVAYVGGTEVSGPSKFLTHAIPALVGIAATGGRAILVPVSVAESVTVQTLALVDLERCEAVWKSVRLLQKTSPISAAADRDVESWHEGVAKLFFDQANQKTVTGR